MQQNAYTCYLKEQHNKYIIPWTICQEKIYTPYLAVLILTPGPIVDATAQDLMY